MDSVGARQRWRRSLAAALAALLLLSGSVSAQWFTISLPNTPRHPDGTPDLTAPTPHTPEGRADLSGIWKRSFSRGGFDFTSGVEVLLLPEAEALLEARRENNSREMPSARCLPHGMTKAMSVPEPFKIVQTPELVVILHEEFNNYRQIFTDGRGVPDNRNRAWFGYSIGRWETGDALAVDTAGIIDDMWLDVPGHPATGALRITERLRRLDFGHLEVDVTIDDAGAYAQPWTFTMWFELMPDTELIEHICENIKDGAYADGR